MQREYLVAFFISDKRINVPRVRGICYILRYVQPQTVLYAQRT